MKPDKVTREQGGGGWLANALHAYNDAKWMLRADPFFSATPEVNAVERETWARQRRAAARALAQHPGHRVGRMVVAFYLRAVFLGLLVTPALITVQSLRRPGGPDMAGVAVGLAWFLLQVVVVAVVWAGNRRMDAGLAGLSGVLGGTRGKNRFLPVLDWLDANWPYDAPLEVTDLQHIFDRRWDLQGSYAGHPVLVHVQRRHSSRHLSPVRRVSFFLSAAGVQQPAGDGAAELRELEAMGISAKRTPAGVYACTHDISPSMLEPGRVSRTLDLLSSLATGRRPGLPGGY